MDRKTLPAELIFSQIAVGQSQTVERTFTASDVARFARISGDFSPLHIDPTYASTTEFGGCVVHGMLLASLFSQLVGMWLPGKHALYLGQDLSFRRPVLVGETVRASARVTAKSEPTRTITLATEIRTGTDKVAVTGTAKVKLRDLALGGPAPARIGSIGSVPTGRRVALVTGGSRGMGAEIARNLAARDVVVAVNYYQSSDSAQRLVEAIVADGGTALPFRADVRNPDDVRQMISNVTEKCGRLDWVVNCAIGELHQRPFIELEWGSFESYLDYQVKAAIQVLQSVHPVMKAAGGGSIVNILSQVTAGQPPPRMADYVTAKYALYGLSKALASEWAEDNIRVNMVSPGLTQTDLTLWYPERLFAMEANRTPLKRIARPSDVAAATAYLLSDEASFLTGINMFVTGGQVMT